MNDFFENLYSDIGIKIKTLAKYIFIVETIAAIITGLCLLPLGGYCVLIGILTIIIGPLIAFASTWLLHAFGELVDSTCENAKNTRTIAKLLQNNSTSGSKSTPVNNSTSISKSTPVNYSTAVDNKNSVNSTTPVDTASHKWRCYNCDNMIDKTPCPYCNEPANLQQSVIPYYCGRCKYPGPYEGECPNCHSSVRCYNV